MASFSVPGDTAVAIVIPGPKRWICIHNVTDQVVIGINDPLVNDTVGDAHAGIRLKEDEKFFIQSTDYISVNSLTVY